MSSKILEEFRAELQSLKKEFLSLPNKLALIENTVKINRNEITETENQMKEIEAEFTYEISLETNGAEKPKPKFSNADARKAELQRRLKLNKPYIELKTRKSELDSDLLNNQIEADRLHNQFRANFAIKDLVVAEMNLHAQLKEALKDD